MVAGAVRATQSYVQLGVTKRSYQVQWLCRSHSVGACDVNQDFWFGISGYCLILLVFSAADVGLRGFAGRMCDAKEHAWQNLVSCRAEEACALKSHSSEKPETSLLNLGKGGYSHVIRSAYFQLVTAPCKPSLHVVGGAWAHALGGLQRCCLCTIVL